MSGCIHWKEEAPCAFCVAYYAAGDVFCPRCALRHEHGARPGKIGCICGHTFDPMQAETETHGSATYGASIKLIGEMINAGSATGRKHIDLAICFSSRLYRLPEERVRADAERYADDHKPSGGRPPPILTLDTGTRP